MAGDPVRRFGCEPVEKEGRLSRSKIALYFLVALVSSAVAYCYLVDEPHPEWPVNLIHLISRH